MTPNRAVGITGYGAYVPRFRVSTGDISAAWRPRGAVAPAVAEKSVPGPDEDVITMAIEAARTALDRARVDPSSIGAIWVGTESKPYAVKPSATVVAEALGITPHVVAADMEFACKAGSEAMQAAVAFVGSGMVEGALAIGMDTAQSKPGDALEYTAACGGAAYLFGAATNAVAVVEASISHVTDTPDFFRREGAAYPEHGGRFTGEPSYFKHTLAASRRLLEECGGNQHMMLAAYNAGMGNARRWFQRTKEELSIQEQVDDIDYKETRAYVQRIIESSHVYASYFSRGEDR